MFRTLLLTLFVSSTVWGQTPQDNDQLSLVIILARHGVRAPIASETRNSAFNALPWPTWPVEPGTLTPHGIEALKRMGEFYRQRYAALLTSGCNSVYAESTNTSRTLASAKATLSAIVPDCVIDVHADLLQDPATIDRQRLADATNGRMANQPEWFEHAFAAPLEEMHSILATCPPDRPTCNTHTPDFRTQMLEAATPPSMSQPQTHQVARLIPRDPRKENSVALGADFAENFLLQYVEGVPMEQVGWGRVSRPTLDRMMEMNTRYHDFILRTPYYAQQAAGPLAKQISDTLVYAPIHAATFLGGRHNGNPEFGRRFFFLSAHDANLTWLGGLLRIDWLVSDETFNATPPGSALVFELHHNNQTNADTVRVLFIAQKLDQIRNLASLTGDDGPSISPVYVPNCSGGAPDYACDLKDFAQILTDAAAGSLSPKASSPAPAAKARAHPATSRPQSPPPSATR
jgi:4-phytase/acid phosphatase